MTKQAKGFIAINAPAAGEVITVSSVRAVQADFDLGSVTTQAAGENLILQLQNGGEVVLENFLAPSNRSAQIIGQDQLTLSADALRAALMNVGEIKTAEGANVALDSGSSFRSFQQDFSLADIRELNSLADANTDYGALANNFSAAANLADLSFAQVAISASVIPPVIAEPINLPPIIAEPAPITLPPVVIAPIVAPAPLPLLFSGEDNNVDFNNVLSGAYRAGSQYDAGEGHDRVTLADTDTLAARAGFAGNEFFAGNGDDIVIGGGRNDTIHGGNGNDTLSGGDGNDTLYAGTGKNILNGGAGDDVLHGGNYNDFITGGIGADTIVWHAGDLYPGEQDEILDFNAADGDKLDISNLLQGLSGELTDLVRFVDEAASYSMLQVRQDDGQWHNVAQLHGVSFSGGTVSYDNIIAAQVGDKI